MTDRHAGVRVALAVGVLAGAGLLAAMVVRRPGTLGWNFEVYYRAASAVLAGNAGDLYAVSPASHPADGFVYPPLAVLAFLPYALVPRAPAFAVHVGLQVLSGLALAWLLVGVTERVAGELGRGDRLLVAGFVAGSAHTVPSLAFGNVNLTLALALAAGLVWSDPALVDPPRLAPRESDRLGGDGDGGDDVDGGDDGDDGNAREDRGGTGDGRREWLAGAAFALPAVVKVFPGTAGVWLLRRRAWRAVGGAAALAAGVGVASLALFGVELHRAYVRAALLDRLDPSLYAGGIDPNAQVVTVRRPLSVVFPSAPSWALALAALGVLAPVVAYCYTHIEGPVDRLVAVHATLVGVLLFFPSYFVYVVYLYFPLVPLLYALEGLPGRLFVAGTLVSVPVGRETVLDALAALPAAVGDPLAAVATPALAFGSLPLYGLALTLVGCVVHRRGRAGDPERS